MVSSLASQTDVPVSAPILIEGILQSLCQGVIFAQVARYWECPLNDTIWMKSYVLALAGLSLCVALVGHRTQKADSPARAKRTDHVYDVQVMVHFYVPQALGNELSLEPHGSPG
jgi:hypothetical protein